MRIYYGIAFCMRVKDLDEININRISRDSI
jgi:hypothetical protein